MREMLFRGKRLDNGQWVAGFYCTNPEWDRKTYGEHHWIISGKNGIKYEVDPATVGQYTGLKDMNGKRIFEGDICQNDKTGGIVFVAWHGTMAGFVWSKKKWCDNLFDFGELFRVHDKYAVIGNIHDNPELLEVR